MRINILNVQVHPVHLISPLPSTTQCLAYNTKGIEHPPPSDIVRAAQHPDILHLSKSTQTYTHLKRELRVQKLARVLNLTPKVRKLETNFALWLVGFHFQWES